MPSLLKLPKNSRNMQKFREKQKRGPVRAFFHITRNENLPAIMTEGLRINSKNANVNSAKDPFAALGVKGGGNWVAQRPDAFQVYGTLIGGKGGNEQARREALSTLKLEIPRDRLKQMIAVKDPYGATMRLTDASDPDLFTPVRSWDSLNSTSAVLLKDIPPEQITNLGYLEERNIKNPVFEMPRLLKMPSSNTNFFSRELSRADRAAMSGVTGHDRTNYLEHARIDSDKSPSRFVQKFLMANQPIEDRVEKLPRSKTSRAGSLQFPKFDNLAGLATKPERLRVPLTADDWTKEYRPYSKPGEQPRRITFQPGAISRGVGTVPNAAGRKFNWNKFKENLAYGESPWLAAQDARPQHQLNWDNIIYEPNIGYHPEVKPAPAMSEGAISRGPEWGHATNNYGEPLSVYDVYKGLKRIEERGGPIMRTHAELERYHNIVVDHLRDSDINISRHATWPEIYKAMMKHQAQVLEK